LSDEEQRLIRKIGSLVFITWVLAMLASCGAQRQMISPSRVEIKEPDERAVFHFVDGIILDLNENFPAALLSYQEALLYDSTSAAIHMAIGKDYIRMGKNESAVISFKKALDLNSEEMEAREFLSEIYRQQGKWDLAERESREILARDSTSAESYFTLANVYLQKNDLKKAAVMYRRLLALLPVPDPMVVDAVGELYIELGQLDSAVSIFQKLIELDPNEGYGYFRIGGVKEAKGDPNSAMENYIRALQLNPKLIHARIRLSEMYVQKKQYDEAIQLYSEAVALDSTDLESYQQMGIVQYEKGDTTEALKTFAEIKQRFPNDWRAYYRLGIFYLSRNQVGMAFNEFKRIIDLSPEVPYGWLYTGISLVHLDSLQLSQKYLLRALDLDPDNPDGNYYMGTILTQFNRPREAVPYLRTALNKNPGRVDVMSSLANAYDSLQEYERSDSLYRASLKLDPENSTILNNYAYSLSQREMRLEEALEMAERALESEPENGAFLDTVGWIYYKKQEYGKALDYIQKSISVRTGSAEVFEHLGDVYSRLGRTDEARKAWESALELDEDNLSILKKLGR
jgi:tetratricopeptide (TPR) repeat protein